MEGYKVMFFFNIPQHGDLHLDKILFSFENVPMIFVCRNNKNEYFLCQCVDVITGISWMITPVSTKLLIRLIKDEISVLTAFSESGHAIILADFNKKGLVFRKVPFCDIPLDELPDQNEKLENSNLYDYIVELENIQ